MGRAQARPTPLYLGSTTAAKHRSHVKELTKPAYRVVLEQVTQQKKKLVILVCILHCNVSASPSKLPSFGQGSFKTEPPRGYTFVAAGDPQLTGRCKELARLDGAKVFVVSVGLG